MDIAIQGDAVCADTDFSIKVLQGEQREDAYALRYGVRRRGRKGRWQHHDERALAAGPHQDQVIGSRSALAIGNHGSRRAAGLAAASSGMTMSISTTRPDRRRDVRRPGVR